MTLTATDLQTILEPERAADATYIDADGWVINAGGEVLGRIDLAERFEVDSADSADWVLQLRSSIEGNLAGLVARRTALVAMLDSLIVDQRKRLSWWEYRFASSLTTYARSILTGKNRTAKFAWGQVGFRKVAGTTSIIDDAAALAFVETWAPDKVKVVRTVNVTAVKAALAAAQAACPDDEIETPFLATSGEGESVSIQTGIEIERTKK